MKKKKEISFLWRKVFFSLKKEEYKLITKRRNGKEEEKVT